MRIALYAGSFNPPGLHHCQIINTLEKIFDLVFIIPCGQCPGKTGIVESHHRMELIRLAFAETSKIKIDFKDATNETFTRPYELDAEYQKVGTSWYVIGSDIILGGSKKSSSIHRNWKNGEYVWSKLNFAIITRPGHEPPNEDMPPNSMLIRATICGSSSAIRERIMLKSDIAHLLSKNVLEYIAKYELYGYSR